MNIFYGLNKSKLPIIPIIIKKENLCFIIDTGSTNSLIDCQVVEYFKDIVKPIGKYSIIGIEGTRQEVDVVFLPFIFEGQTYKPKFCVKPLLEVFGNIEEESGIQIHGILGIDFLMDNKWIIDFNKLELRND